LQLSSQVNAISLSSYSRGPFHTISHNKPTWLWRCLSFVLEKTKVDLTQDQSSWSLHFHLQNVVHIEYDFETFRNHLPNLRWHTRSTSIVNWNGANFLFSTTNAHYNSQHLRGYSHQSSGASDCLVVKDHIGSPNCVNYWTSMEIYGK
jgi:hypothetical protein